MAVMGRGLRRWEVRERSDSSNVESAICRSGRRPSRAQKKTAGRLATGGWWPVQPVLSRKPSSCRLRTGCWSLRTALASIWRTRSRVTLKIRPTSSRV